MGRRRRVLLAVEPRILADSLAVVLAEIGLDDVLVFDPDRADTAPMPFDAAIVSRRVPEVVADVIVEIPPDRPFGRVTTAGRTDEVALRTPLQLVSALDRFCPSILPRAAALAAGGVHR